MTTGRAGTAGPTRIGLIGLNERAQRLIVRGLRASPRARLVAFCSRDAAKASAWAAEIGEGARGFTDPAALARSGEVDAVFVNTPPDSHLEICLAAIEAGVGVICEKPLAPTLAQARRLADAARTRAVPTVVNYTYRSMPGYRLTERLLADEGFGDWVHAEFGMLQGRNFVPGVQIKSAIVDTGPHLFDLWLGLGDLAGLGWPRRVFATVGRRADGVDHACQVAAETELRVPIGATFGRATIGYRNGVRWGLHGDRASLHVELDADWTRARLAHRDDERAEGRWREIAMPADLAADYERFPAYHFDRLVGALRGEVAFPDFEDAARAAILADAVERAAAERVVVPVPTPG